MAVDDRDWYKDAIRKREAKEDARYYPKQFRGKRRPYISPQQQPPKPPEPPELMHWTLWVLLFGFAFIILHMLIKYTR